MHIRPEDNVRTVDEMTCNVHKVMSDHFFCKEGHKHMMSDVTHINGTVVTKQHVNVVAVNKDKPVTNVVAVKKDKPVTKVVAVKKDKPAKKTKKIGLDLDGDGIADVIIDADLIDIDDKD